MSSAQERNIRFYEASYLNAVKRGLEDKSTQVQESKYDNDNDNDRDNRDNSSSSDDEIQTRSKTTRKTERRNERNARKQHTTTTKQTKQTVAVTQKESASSPIVEKKEKKLTKRQQVLQRYADEETAGIASVLASMADAAVTRSQARNRNTVMWTESDRAAASRAAAITLEVATLAAEATQGKKKKEQLTPYWTRLHEKNRSTVRFQKEIGRVMECDFY
jgi:hypothetical protein